MTDLQFSEWRGEGFLRHRVLIRGTIECGDFYCETCGDCIACYGGWSEEHECWAAQYADEVGEDSTP